MLPDRVGVDPAFPAALRYTLSTANLRISFLTGTASGETAPATATLFGGADRRFEITFTSSSSLSGAFFKGADNVGAVSATK